MKTYNSYLVHYGVKGMKWGIRHDPIRNSRHNISTKHKKILKRIAIGAAITGGVLLASYGALKINDIYNYKKINKAAKSAVQEVLRSRNRDAIKQAKKEYSHKVYDNFPDKKQLIIDSYKQRVNSNRLEAIKDEKRLTKEGYKTFKKWRTKKIKELFSPSPFADADSMYDPYEMIDYYRKLG